MACVGGQGGWLHNIYNFTTVTVCVLTFIEFCAQVSHSSFVWKTTGTGTNLFFVWRFILAVVQAYLHAWVLTNIRYKTNRGHEMSNSPTWSPLISGPGWWSALLKCDVALGIHFILMIPSLANVCGKSIPSELGGWHSAMGCVAACQVMIELIWGSVLAARITARATGNFENWFPSPVGGGHCPVTGASGGGGAAASEPVQAPVSDHLGPGGVGAPASPTRTSEYTEVQ